MTNAEDRRELKERRGEVMEGMEGKGGSEGAAPVCICADEGVENRGIGLSKDFWHVLNVMDLVHAILALDFLAGFDGAHPHRILRRKTRHEQH